MTPAAVVPAAGPPDLRAILERARRRPRVTRATPRVVAFSTLRPWRAQRHALRSDAPTRVVVAGRQGGKTLMAAFAALRVAFARPGSLSALLVPGYRWAETAIARLVQVAGELPGVRWKEQKKKFVLPNGATIEVFSADRKDGGVRGPTITGIYWIDEGAYVPEAAYDSGNPAQIASKGRLKLVTTTPAGKNWVGKLFAGDDPTVARFRFRSEDAPHTDKDEIARLRRAMTPERAAQEFDAVFVDDLLLAFPSVDRLFVDRHLERRSERDVRNVLGSTWARSRTGSWSRS